MLFFSVLLMSHCLPGQTNDPKTAEYYNNGMYLLFRKDYTGAIADFSEAISRDSGFIQAFENRGVAKYYLKDYSGAVEDYSLALEINPEDFNTCARRGWAKFKLYDYSGAIEDFTNALKGEVRDAAGCYLTRGQSKYYLKDFNGAIADFDRVTRFWLGNRDQRAEAWFWRGVVEIDLGQKAKACLDFNKAGKSGYKKAYDLLVVYCQ